MELAGAGVHRFCLPSIQYKLQASDICIAYQEQIGQLGLQVLAHPSRQDKGVWIVLQGDRAQIW